MAENYSFSSEWFGKVDEFIAYKVLYLGEEDKLINKIREFIKNNILAMSIGEYFQNTRVDAYKKRLGEIKHALIERCVYYKKINYEPCYKMQEIIFLLFDDNKYFPISKFEISYSKTE